MVSHHSIFDCQHQGMTCMQDTSYIRRRKGNRKDRSIFFGMFYRSKTIILKPVFVEWDLERRVIHFREVCMHRHSQKTKTTVSIFILVDFARFFGYKAVNIATVHHPKHSIYFSHFTGMLARSYRYVWWFKGILLVIAALMLGWHIRLQQRQPTLVSTTFLIPAGLTVQQRTPLQSYIITSLAQAREGEHVGVVLLGRWAEYLIPETVVTEQALALIQTMVPPTRDVPSPEELAHALQEREDLNNGFSQGILLDANWWAPVLIGNHITSPARMALGWGILLLICLAVLL